MPSPSFLVVCLNPTFQKTIVIDKLVENEVLRSNSYYLTLAGKGVNTTRVLRELGQQAVHITHLGGRRREHFLSMIEEENIPVLWAESGSEIRTCTTLISRSGATTTEIVEEPPAVAPGTDGKIRGLYTRHLPGFDAVVIAGTKAPGYTDSIIPDMVKSAVELGKMVFLDIKGTDLLNSLPYQPTVIKPNFSEFTRTFLPDADQGEHNINIHNKELVQKRMLEIFRDTGTVSVITSGANPTMFLENGRIASMPVHPITPVNTIGSGDSFTAGMASILASGGSIREAVTKGQECGAVNAQNIIPGTILNPKEQL